MIEFLEGENTPKDDRYLIVIPRSFVITSEFQIKLEVCYPNWEIKNFSEAENNEDKEFKTWINELFFIRKAIDESMSCTFPLGNALLAGNVTNARAFECFFERLKYILNNTMISNNHWIIYHQTEV